MSGYRFMRVVVFFDLPVETAENRRDYRRFRRILIMNGFIMLQESVYCKLIPTPSVEQSVRRLILQNKPPKGLVQMLIVTEKQFAKMEYIVGENTSDIIDSEDRLVIL